MSWFVFALISTFGWGLADLFYKKSSDSDDRYSHLKLTVWVGTVMMAVSLLLLIISSQKYSLKEWLLNALKYSPASFGYILSMIIGYAGMRYLEISVISPVQNASGAFSAIAMIIFFVISGQVQRIKSEISVLDIIGTVIIVFGVILLSLAESKIARIESENNESINKFGALALLFPILYCVFDTIGTAADGIILSDSGVGGLSEIAVLILYGFTFFTVSVFSYIYMLLREKKFYNPFKLSEVKTKGVAAVFEEAGQLFYVYAMADKPFFAAPLISSYCIVSVILSRTVLKEKLNKMQYASVFSVIAGIVLLGISEGIAEI